MASTPSKIDRVQYYEGHIAPFTANAVAIGTTTADVTDLGTKTTAARAAYNAQQAALQTAKNATAAFYDAVDAMNAKGAAIIKTIRAKAELTNNPAIYTMAEIPAPATPTSKGNPGRPFDFTVQLNANGTLDLAWKCNNPVGTSTMYQVYRSPTGVPGTFTYVGGTGERKVTDSTLPIGSTRATYQVQAVRTNAVGPFAEFNVTFGSVGAPPTVSDATIKLAA